MSTNKSYTKNSAIDIAKKAGEIAKKYFGTSDLVSTSKSEIDFLTEADKEIDDFIRQSIKEHFPAAQLLTEETATDDFSFIKEAENLWVVDPIDGTANFSRSGEHFSISIALVNKGQPSLGIVYLPIEDRLYFASTDDDHATCNDKIITVSKIDDLKKATIAYDWSWDLEKRKEMLKILEKIYLQIRQPRSLGSAAAELCMVADGRLDGYINTGLNPWDIAAGILIAQKAGASVTSLDKSELSVFSTDILAASKAISEKLNSILI